MLYLPGFNFWNVSTACALCLVGCLLVIRELSPKTQLAYSKFSKVEATKESPKINSRDGMLLIYSPAFITSIYLLCSCPMQQKNAVFLMILNAIHYMKRVYEVLHVHRYSGSMKIIDGITISLSYFSSVPVMYYLATQVPNDYESSSALSSGIIIFFIGEAVNHYHHIILSNLRGNGPKEYKIPQGGLFRFVWCPHYLGEIAAFTGMTLVSLNSMTIILLLSTAGYLCVRSYATRKWYQEKFKVIPSRYCIFPGIF